MEAKTGHDLKETIPDAHQQHQMHAVKIMCKPSMGYVHCILLLVQVLFDIL